MIKACQQRGSLVLFPFPAYKMYKYLIIKLCYGFIRFPHKMCKTIMHTVNYWLTTKDTSLILTVGWFLYGVSLLSTSLQTHLIIAIIKRFRHHSDNLFFFISKNNLENLNCNVLFFVKLKGVLFFLFLKLHFIYSGALAREARLQSTVGK